MSQAAGETTDTFAAAAARWLSGPGRAHAERLLARHSLQRWVSAGDVCDDAMVALLTTLARNGDPVDPSDGEAVAAYVYRVLSNRVHDRGRAVRRQQHDVPWDDDLQEQTASERDDVDALLGAWLFDCVRRVLQQRARRLDELLDAQVALAALTYLQVGPPPDAPAPATKGSAWTRAGWAALATVDRDHFFPPEDAVKANTATQRRRTALARTRALLRDAVVECGSEAC